MSQTTVPFTEDLRQFTERLRQEGELIDLRQPIDIRHIATLVDQSDKAILFHHVIGYDMPVLSGIVRTQKRAVMSVGCSTFIEIEDKLKTRVVNDMIKGFKIKSFLIDEVLYSSGVFIPYIITVIILYFTGVFDKFWFWRKNNFWQNDF
jgi:3-polyprenyl-4-hydroxybenzoate decarboxylase